MSFSWQHLGHFFFVLWYMICETNTRS
jgi:hypothetical protein